MEMLTWLEIMLMFFNPNPQLSKKPDDASVAQCYQWVEQAQHMFAQPLLCERAPLTDTHIPDIVLQANRCDEILSRREVELFVKKQPIYGLLDERILTNKPLPKEKTAAYCASVSEQQFQAWQQDFQREFKTIRSDWNMQPENESAK